MNFGDNILLWVLIPLFILFISASYFRFVINNDYLVNYEAPCDPQTQSCFSGCSDEQCQETYPYLLIERHASELNKLCGNDVVDCPFANTCESSGDKSCKITYCDQTVSQNCLTDKVDEINQNAI